MRIRTRLERLCNITTSAHSKGRDPTIIMTTMTLHRDTIRSPRSTPPPSSNRIRHTFLNKLGIDQKRETNSSEAGHRPAHRSMLGNVRVTQEPLKYAEFKHSQRKWRWERLFGGELSPMANLSSSPPTTPTALSSETSSFSSTEKSNRRLTFNEDVKVVPIPMRDEYSDRIKDRLWMNAEEIQRNAERNALEFRSEGFDWRNALVEDNMFTCVETGELIHPVHCDPNFLQS